jgi:cytochrome c
MIDMKFLIAISVSLFVMVAQVHAEDEDGLVLARKKGCLGCHNIERSEVGPAWREVAKKYRSESNASKQLSASILYGSMGHWGDRVMRGNAKRVSKEEAQTLANFILALP